MSNAAHLIRQAISEFADAHAKDERYTAAIEHLRSAETSLAETMPDAAPSAGDRAVSAANSRKPEDNRPPQPEVPADQQPKNFAQASQVARERMQATA